MKNLIALIALIFSFSLTFAQGKGKQKEEMKTEKPQKATEVKPEKKEKVEHKEVEESKHSDKKTEIEKEYNVNKLNKTYAVLKITGYTDGSRFNNDQCDSLFTVCIKEFKLSNGYDYTNEFENMSSDSCNMCLSYLRSKRLGLLLKNNLDIFNSDVGLNIVAKGAYLSNGTTEKNNSLRKSRNYRQRRCIKA